MSYCAVADVQGEFKSMPITATSFVTLTTVQSFIDQASALIDSYVGSRYVVPITGPSALLLMQLYCSTLVADRMRGILANKQATNVDANQNYKAPGMSTSDVLKALKDIQNGTTALVDGQLILSQAGFYSQTAAMNVTPKFHKNRREW